MVADPIEGLFERVLAEPADLSALLVLADALQQAGDAQGTLISLQAEAERLHGIRSAALDRQRRLLLLEKRAELLGPLAALPEVKVAWRLGFTHALEVSLTGDGQLAALAEGLRRPAFRRCERLHLRFEQVSHLAPLFAACPGTLRALRLETAEPVDWPVLLEGRPTLDELFLVGGGGDFSAAGFDDLRVLGLTCVANGLEAAHVPNLEQLVVLPGADGQPALLDDLPESIRVVRALRQVWRADENVRLVLEHDGPSDDELDEGQISGESYATMELRRLGPGTAFEWAWLLTPAPLDVVQATVRAIAGPLEAILFSAAEVTLGGARFTALELHAVTSHHELLAAHGVALAERGHPAVEFASSPSRRDVLVREHAPGGGRRTLSSGGGEPEAHLRLGVELAFGFDPGPVLDVLRLALDAEPLRPANGPPGATRAKFLWMDEGAYEHYGWQIVGPFGEGLATAEDPRFAEDDFDDGWSAVAASDMAPPSLEWQLEIARFDAAVAAGEPPVDPDEQLSEEEQDLALEDVGDDDLSPEGWTLSLAEAPLEVEDDGVEPTPEAGLVVRAPAYDDEAQASSVFGDGDAACEVCGAEHLRLAPCPECEAIACRACARAQVTVPWRCAQCG